MAEDLSGSLKETLRHSLTYGLGEILSKALGFLLIPIYTKYLSPSDYGILSLLVITFSLSTTIFELGLTSAFFRSYFDYKDERKRSVVVSTALYILVAMAILLSVIGYWFSPSLSLLLFDDLKFSRYLSLIFFTSSLHIVHSFVFFVYRAKKLSTLFSLLNISFFLAQITLTIYLVVWSNQGIWGIILAHFIVEMTFLPVFLFSIRKDIALFFSGSELSKMLLFGLPLVLQNIAGFILNSSDSYFLKVFSTMKEVGLYNLGYKFGMLIHLLLVIPLTMIWTPMMLSLKDKTYADEYYSKMLTYFSLAGIFLVLSVTLLSKDVLIMVVDSAYWSANKIIPLIALSYLFLGAQRIIHVGFALKRKTMYSAVIFGAGCVINLVLNFFLIPPFGMIGAAIATLVSFVFICVIKYPLSMKLYRIRYQFGRIAKIFLCALALYFLGSAIDVQKIWLSLLLKSLVVLSLPVLLVPLQFYSDAEKETVGQIISSYMRRSCVVKFHRIVTRRQRP